MTSEETNRFRRAFVTDRNRLLLAHPHRVLLSMRSGSLAPGGSVAPLREKRASRFSVADARLGRGEEVAATHTSLPHSRRERQRPRQCLPASAEGEGFEPSGRLATASDFRDRAEPAAMPHRNWSPHPGGMQGGMNLSPPFGRRCIGSVVGRKTSNCSRAFHRVQQRVRVASRTLPLRWGSRPLGRSRPGFPSSSLAGVNCASLRVPQARAGESVASTPRQCRFHGNGALWAGPCVALLRCAKQAGAAVPPAGCRSAARGLALKLLPQGV
jgi:hypothetical protein